MVRLNWVVIIAGLIPLWAVIFITFSKIKTLTRDDLQATPPKETLPKPIPEEEVPVFTDLLEETKQEDPFKDEILFNDDPETTQPQEKKESIDLPAGIRRLWGAAFVFVFLACLAFSSEKVLDYAFREYRWVIGMENPWINQLAFNTMATSGIAILGLMVATLRTGIYLLRN